jgi:hypothetical protein
MHENTSRLMLVQRIQGYTPAKEATMTTRPCDLRSSGKKVLVTLMGPIVFTSTILW